MNFLKKKKSGGGSLQSDVFDHSTIPPKIMKCILCNPTTCKVKKSK